MTGTTHLFFGISTAFIDICTSSHTEAFLFGSIIGSLLPDIDTPNSIVGASVPAISQWLNTTFGHRKAIHSPFVLLLLCIAARYSESMAGLAFGYAGHLFLDLFNRGGIPLFYPLSKKNFHLSKMRYNSKAAGYITQAFVALFLIMRLYIWHLL